MDCETYQGALPDLLYGELDAEERPVVLAHRAGCSACDGLTRDLEAVKGGLPSVGPPPLVTAKIKLAARDELLARAAQESGAGAAPLRSVLVAVLALCVGLVGFALGVAWERPQATEPTLHVPRTPTDLPRADPAWLDTAADAVGSRHPQAPPRAPEAWQRVLYDSASGLLERGDHGQARTFFARAFDVAPEGPLAAPAHVGEAEAALRQGDRAEARRLLRETRALVLGGRIVGGPGLLQRLDELEAGAGE